jgi:lipoate-protein ligase A
MRSASGGPAIFHIARDQNFSVIPKEEVKADLIETIQKLKEDFSKLIDQ